MPDALELFILSNLNLLLPNPYYCNIIQIFKYKINKIIK
jgi:hypothetical protein